MTTQFADPAKNTSTKDLNRQIVQYSLAAAAAGVSLLALAQPAAGEVVVTHRTIPIPLANHQTPHPVKLSLANDGNDNFFFGLSSTPASAFNNFPDRELFMEGKSKDDGVIVDGFSSYTMDLERSSPIGKKSTYFKWGFALIEASTSFQSGRRFVGYWGGNPSNRYLGVRFQIDGEIHYGWIRLTVTTSTELHGPVMSAEINEYAYETIPNKPLLAGVAGMSTAGVLGAEDIISENTQDKPGPSLGMLAVGAKSLPMWRREEALISR